MERADCLAPSIAAYSIVGGHACSGCGCSERVPIAWPLEVLLAAFSKTTHPIDFTFDAALPWVLHNTPTACEVDRMNGCQDNLRTDRQAEIPSICT